MSDEEQVRDAGRLPEERRDADSEDDERLAADVDAWTAEPEDPDQGGPAAEFVDAPENTPAAEDA